MPDGVPFRRLSTGPVSIGEGCFLGPGVIVSDGACIGKFSVIGPGAVVLSNIPDYSVYMARPGMFMGSTVKQPSSPPTAPDPA
jgi:acetyltransferase-like isoleucine patch superfamily enzyme